MLIAVLVLLDHRAGRSRLYGDTFIKWRCTYCSRTEVVLHLYMVSHLVFWPHWSLVLAIIHWSGQTKWNEAEPFQHQKLFDHGPVPPFCFDVRPQQDIKGMTTCMAFHVSCTSSMWPLGGTGEVHKVAQLFDAPQHWRPVMFPTMGLLCCWSDNSWM